MGRGPGGEVGGRMLGPATTTNGGQNFLIGVQLILNEKHKYMYIE